MLKQILVFIFAVSFFPVISECARILAIAPLPSYSHQVAYRPIWKALSLKGHNVTLITTDPINDPTLTNLTEVDIHDTTYHAWKSSGIIGLMRKYQKNPFKIRDKFIQMYIDMLHAVMDHQSVKPFLKNDSNFDLVITEPLIPVGLAFAAHYNSKLILVTSLEAPTYIHIALGNPFHPVIYPEDALAITPNTYLKRVFISLLSLYYFYFQYNFSGLTTSFLQKYFDESLPPFEELLDRSSMLFVNVNPIFAGVRPITPSTVYFGRGSHLLPEKPLPTDLKNFLDEAEEGVVYFSLGTNVLSVDLEDEKKKILLDAFSELPFKFLWKYEDESLGVLPKNVKIAKWIPQQDVLRHPNVKAFITQGGLQSTEEAIFSNVPIIGMPQIGDQVRNVQRVVKLGLGVHVDFESLNKEELKSIIIDVATNKSYRENMKHFVKLSIDWPRSGIDEVVWWTEYVLRHKNTEHLKGPARKVPVLEYLLLDVIAGLLLVVITVIYLSIKIVKLISKILRILWHKITNKPHRD